MFFVESYVEGREARRSSKVWCPDNGLELFGDGLVVRETHKRQGISPEGEAMLHQRYTRTFGAQSSPRLWAYDFANWHLSAAPIWAREYCEAQSPELRMSMPPYSKWGLRFEGGVTKLLVELSPISQVVECEVAAKGLL